MTEDLEAIDYLAGQWSAEVDNAPTAGSLGLTSNAVAGAVPMYPSAMLDKGLNILRMYEAESEKYPDDEDVDVGLVNHLYSLGFMHYRKITFAYGLAKEGKSSADGDKACSYLKRAYEIGFDPRSADLLGNIFQRVDFYATAIHWMKAAEHGVEIN